MKTVWVVFKLHYNYDTPDTISELDAIFASKTKAESYVNNITAEYKARNISSYYWFEYYWFEIEEKEFDSEE